MRIRELQPAPPRRAIARPGPRPIDRRRIEAARAVLRAIDRDQVRDAMVEEYRRREERRLERELRRGRPGPVQCFSCKRFKPRPSSVCGQCGDDPVGNVTNGDPSPSDRMAFDAAHYGERVL